MRHGLGWLAMIIGVLGALICLLIVPAAWVVHGAAQPRARALIDAVDGSLAQAAALLGEAEAAVGTAESRLASLQRRAATIAAGPGAGAEERAELRALLEGVAGVDYGAARAAYIAARERASASLATLRQLAWVPGVRAPSDELIQQAIAIDARLQALDTNLAALRATLEGSELSPSEAAARLATQAQAFEQQLAGVDELIGSYSTAVDTVRARLPGLAVTTDRVITGSAVGLALVALYGVVLHGALFLLGRIWARGSARPATTSSAASR